MHRILPLIAAACCQAAMAGPWSSCLEIADDRQRLACYDRYARALEKASAPQARAEDFGLPAREPARELDAVEARITRIEKLAYGRRLIVLDNGQTWKTLESRSQPRLKAGLQVRIRRAALGSFLLSRPEGGAVLRVKRIR